MPKFFVERGKITADKIIIDTGDAAHISRVLLSISSTSGLTAPE